MRMKPNTTWSFLLAFSTVFLPAIFATGLWAGWYLEIRSWWVAMGFFALALIGMAAAWWANYSITRQYAENLGSIESVLDLISKGQVADRIPFSQRSYIESIASAVDRLQEFLKNHYAELRSHRDQLSTVLNTMVEGVIVVDSQQRVVLLNESAYRLFRLPRGAEKRLLFELVRNPQLQHWVGRTLAKRETCAGELEILSPVQKTLNVRVQGLPAGSTGGEAMIVATDVSQLRKLERVRQEFVANASHELKTPLASIKACVETLIDGGAIDDLEVRDRFLTMVGEQAERLDNLVRDLLSLTRIESEGRKSELVPVRLATVVTQCVARQRQNAERKSMRLLVEPPAVEVSPLAEDEALEHILENLIDNAIKYTNAGGTVTIRWREEREQCVLEVEDTGIGIPQHHLTRIFERFYRVDKARSREVGGTGLGLSIVKHLTQSLGGEVTVSSRLGQGTVFQVWLATARNSSGGDTE